MYRRRVSDWLEKRRAYESGDFESVATNSKHEKVPTIKLLGKIMMILDKQSKGMYRIEVLGMDGKHRTLGGNTATGNPKNSSVHVAG